MAALVAVAGLAGCNRAPETPARAVERVAIIDFDNQSADAAASPLGQLIAQVTVLQLAGDAQHFVFNIPHATDAPARRATQLVTGYLTHPQGPGPWTLHVQVRDAATPRTLRAFALSAPGPGALADGLAAEFGKPGFTAAAMSAEALAAATRGAGDLSALSEVARLKVSPFPTELRTRTAALQHYVELAPSDSETNVAAAGHLMLLRQFEPAVQAYRRAQHADPAWPELFNEAAFGFAFAGDLPAALASVAEYRKLEPRSGNPSDSEGEVLFTHRKFAEAERAFLAAFNKNPALLGGATLRKAAEARRASGNQAEADRIFARYAAALAKQPLLPLEQARWDYTSGRTADALAALEAFAAKSNASPAWTQVAAWRAAAGKHAEAAAAAQLALKNARSGGEQQSAIVAAFATQAPASPAEWQARAVKQFPPAAAPLARPALVYALVLGKHWREALPLIAAERDALAPPVAGFWQGLLARAYAELGDEVKAKTESRFAPIPRTVGDATWDFLLSAAKR